LPLTDHANVHAHQKTPFALDPTPLFNFALFTLLNTPPNFLWQQFLEETFPGTTIAPAIVPMTNTSEKPSTTNEKKEIIPRKTLNKQNTLIKFLLDQTLGALFNTIVFIAGMAALKGQDYADIVQAVRAETWGLMSAGYKLWPMVSLLNFTVVPFEYRMLFGGLVGMGWGVFLSLVAG